MKATDLLLYLLCIVGALAGYFLARAAAFMVRRCRLRSVRGMDVLRKRRVASATVLRLAGLSWSMEDFVRGWLITGRTGSGKTQCAINTITYQVFQNVPNWGGICLDQKGLYWEILVKMAAHFGRERDLVLLQTRPLGKDELWRPAHTINITGNRDVPASTYAKVIVDTAASLTGGRGQNPFFPTKAQIAIQTGFEILRHIGRLCHDSESPSICLLNREDAAATVEKLANAGDQRSHRITRRLPRWLSWAAAGAAWRRTGNHQHLSCLFLESRNLRSLLCERADILYRRDRRGENRLHRHAAEISI